MFSAWDECTFRGLYLIYLWLQAVRPGRTSLVDTELSNHPEQGPREDRSYDGPSQSTIMSSNENETVPHWRLVRFDNRFGIIDQRAYSGSSQVSCDNESGSPHCKILACGGKVSRRCNPVKTGLSESLPYSRAQVISSPVERDADPASHSLSIRSLSTGSLSCSCFRVRLGRQTLIPYGVILRSSVDGRGVLRSEKAATT